MGYISPKKIRRGSKVAVVAPASAIHSDQLAVGINLIKEAGLVPVLGPCVRKLRTDGLHSAPIKERVMELNWAFSDPQISAVICALGGMGSSGVLPHLDYELIKKSRKPLLGRSDITSLNMGLLQHAGLMSINGQTPSIHIDKGERYEIDQSESFLSTLEMMMGSDVWGSTPVDSNPHVPQTVRPGRASGPAIGGHGDTLTRLLGTPHLPDFTGAILFIEDIHQSCEDLSREFLHLKLAGVLDQVAGVVIGEFQDVKKRRDEPSVDDVVLEYFSDGPPCVYGYPFSHGPIVAPIPIGAQCTLDADACSVAFDFKMG